MSEKNPASQPSGIDRRQWITSAVSLAASAAAAPLLGNRVDAAEQAAQVAKPAGTPTVVAPNSGNIVEIACGRIRGFSRNGILAFKGIPYGASTAGAGRYMAPAKPAPWPACGAAAWRSGSRVHRVFTCLKAPRWMVA